MRMHDAIAFPSGSPEVAHPLLVTGATAVHSLALSTTADVETCEYPDAGKVLVIAGLRGWRGLRRMAFAGDAVEFCDPWRSGSNVDQDRRNGSPHASMITPSHRSAPGGRPGPQAPR